MIRKMYKDINVAFAKEKYHKVTELIEEALEIPDFGFNLKIIYKYAYSLLETGRVEEGISLYKKMLSLDLTSEPHLQKHITKFLEKQKHTKIRNLKVEDYLREGNTIHKGLVVYLKPDKMVLNEWGLSKETYSYFYYMIWKIENDKVYAFPIKRYKNHGYRLSGFKYNKQFDMAADTFLVSFDINTIASIHLEFTLNDYKKIINDLYERTCVLRSLNDLPKNYFVSEIEKNIQIEVGDVIAVYDQNDRYRHYYFIREIDLEQGIYKGVKISHCNGDIVLKEEKIIDIPISSYIMGKLFISEENKQRITEAIASLEENINRR